MRRALRPALIALAGCGALPVGRGDELGPAFRVSGPVEGAAVSGDRTIAGIGWAWVVDGEVGGVTAEAPFEPLVYRYALEVPPPPDPAGGGARPSGLPAVDAPLLVGLPYLVEPTGRAAPEPEIDAEALLAWALGERPDPRGVVSARGGEVVAVTPGHLLFLAALPRGAAALGEVDGWPLAGAPCRLEGLVDGLTLYRDEGTGCGGWAPLAPAGARTEFQGIPMAPP